jgi:phage terminase small subunit
MVGCPSGLTPGQKATWAELAPHATAAKTLTAASVRAFVDLIEAMEVKRRLLARLEKEGWTIDTPTGLKAHPLLPQYRGLLQRVEAGLDRFQLRPLGKPMPGGEEEKPDDPFAEFDAPGGGVQ